jgi:DNA helicase IV
MTVVGDLDQAMSATALGAWADLAPQLPGRLTVHELTVNYRTPAEVMAFVEQQTAIIGIRHHPPRSVRYSGHEPRVETVDPTSLAQAVSREVAALADAPGTVAVIAPASLQSAVAADVDTDAVAILTAHQAKGLEFDAVVMAAPTVIAREEGGAALYVALTRTTRDLVVVKAEDAGEGERSEPVGGADT